MRSNERNIVYLHLTHKLFYEKNNISLKSFCVIVQFFVCTN